LGEFHSDKTRAKAISFAAMFMAFGMVYLPALAWLVVPFRSTLHFQIPLIDMDFAVWRIFIVLCALMNVITVIGIISLPESGKFLLSKGEQAKTVEVLEKVHRWNKSIIPIVIILKSLSKIFATTLL
jgi:MFS transporter, VNT family, synaptic vesicle glycoprotein 2